MITPLSRSIALAASLCLALPGSSRSQAPEEEGADSALFTLRPEPRFVAEIDVPIDPTVAPSPDGRFFAVLQTRPQPVLWIVPSDGGEPFAYRKTWSATKPRWSPSADRIGFIADGGPPRIWTIEVDPETGRPIDPPRMLYRTAVNAYAFAPDGERIAYIPRRTTAAGASEIHIIEWESRKARVLLREDGVIYHLDWSPDGESIYYGVMPALTEEDHAHRVRRARVGDGRTATVLRAGEFLGLSSDGLYLLCRPLGWTHSEGNIVELVGIAGAPVMRIEAAPGPAPRWGTGGPPSRRPVRPSEASHAIWAIPACPFCYLLIR
ncbi:MAG: PD40 domain-containing protein [Gemmatimonadota bacterium]|nr:MAG: PD40 domain-containing protein [Gemmatimonadota bacterium]